MPSLLNTFDAITNDRSIRLQQYLQEILSHENIKNDEILLNFFDITNQGDLSLPPLLPSSSSPAIGASGFRKSVGASQVLRETSLHVSFLSILGLHSWAVHYVGLSKRGVLYLFRTLYDVPDEAIVKIDLRSVDARVVGTSSNNIIKVFNGDVKFYLKFQSIDEFSSWLRQLSDFGVSAAATTTTSTPQSKSNKTKQNKDSNPTQDDIHTSSQQQSSRNAGQTDDFSSTYGM